MITIKGFAKFGKKIYPRDRTLEIQILDVYENGFEFVVRYEDEPRNNRKDNRNAKQNV
jgi:hypothetical protein